MRVSTKRILSILTGLVFLLGAVMVYVGLTRGELAEVEKVRNLLASKETLLANQERAVGQVKGLLDEFKNFAQLQATVSRAVPNGPATVSAVRQIEAVARAAGAAVAGVSLATPSVGSRGAPGAESVVKRLRTLEARVRADGSYANLKQFVKLLETSVRVANITTMNYAASGAGGSSDTLTLEVEMYYQE